MTKRQKLSVQKPKTISDLRSQTLQNQVLNSKIQQARTPALPANCRLVTSELRFNKTSIRFAISSRQCGVGRLFCLQSFDAKLAFDSFNLGLYSFDLHEPAKRQFVDDDFSFQILPRLPALLINKRWRKPQSGEYPFSRIRIGHFSFLFELSFDRRFRSKALLEREDCSVANPSESQHCIIQVDDWAAIKRVRFKLGPARPGVQCFQPYKD